MNEGQHVDKWIRTSAWLAMSLARKSTDSTTADDGGKYGSRWQMRGCTNRRPGRTIRAGCGRKALCHFQEHALVNENLKRRQTLLSQSDWRSEESQENCHWWILTSGIVGKSTTCCGAVVQTKFLRGNTYKISPWLGHREVLVFEFKTSAACASSSGVRCANGKWYYLRKGTRNLIHMELILASTVRHNCAWICSTPRLEIRR